jgi:mRNA-degrading endonuclease RelE of RelBE toxin-antitoxin system
MKVEFKNSFLKDLKKLKNKSLQNSIYNCILQIESAPNVSSIKNIKKLKGFETH